nr:immunoglobulin light chain junction region [Macaca mulatta]
CLQFKPYPNSF